MQRRLLNIQRKQLHDILINAEVDPAVARWTDDRKSWTSDACETIEIGLCYFLFKPGTDNDLSIKMRPSYDGGVEMGRVGVSWGEVLSLFSRWARLVKSEIETEDPWSKYAALLPPEPLTKGASNAPFTHIEAEDASRAISALLSYLTESIANFENVSVAYTEHFDRLKGSAKAGAGRIDWSNQFVGLVISLCLTLALSPQQAAGLWSKWI